MLSPEVDRWAPVSEGVELLFGAPSGPLALVVELVLVEPEPAEGLVIVPRDVVATAGEELGGIAEVIEAQSPEYSL